MENTQTTDITELLQNLSIQEQNNTNLSKPLLKWVGGKTQILDKVFEHFPCTIQNYYEPFIGGGSVLLHLLEKQLNKEIIIKGNIFVSDNNLSLIHFYKTIHSSPNDFWN